MVKHLKTLGLLAGIMLSASTFAASFEEGKHYVKVDGFAESHAPVVREFFSYNCPHCYRFDHTIADTVKLLGNEVQFERTPVSGVRPDWKMSQLAYYVAQKFKVTEQTHMPIFKQVQQVAPFRDEADVKAFFIAQGLKADAIDQALSSSDRQFTLMGFNTQAELAGIRGVPSVLVNGKYMLNVQGLSSEQLAELVKYVAKL
ncbi:thiol:disulfide interchange protein DsbA/DsbL [Shewanella sp. 3B26]|uniref:Thiol:disulfide interchange protein n=1 Tax=Shewanella zhuhaiensis TaxID=2919576 RepID=A0AAJ1BKE0_9GAMM|nr:thiol:disulfide interchange protein DsbA/DsbL [Shewanella zhuhaiensis]MCH4296277.1 thiol:disulfide interchange protein DsbA/DsbL [Shewanella zhuhaiensis]